jgi:hypothetical protein
MKILVSLSSLDITKAKIDLLAAWIHTNDKTLIPKLKAVFPEFVTKTKQTAYRGMKLPVKSFETLKKTLAFKESSFSVDPDVAQDFAKINKPKPNAPKSAGDFGVLYKVEVDAGAFDIDALLNHLNTLSKKKDPSVAKLFDWRDEPWVWAEKELLGNGQGKLESVYVTKKIAKFLDSSTKIVPKTVVEMGQFIAANLIKEL